MLDTIVVVPCFNEARRLDVAEFESFSRRHADRTLLFVNDGSTDPTAALLSQLQRSSRGRLLVRHLPRNVGKAEAVRQGILEALQQAPRFVGYWDADLATPLAEIATLRSVFRQRPEVQLVMGSRVALLGRDIERRCLRHYCGRLFATAAALVLRLPVYDTQCGAKLFRVSARLETLFRQPFCSRWIFDVEILARMTSLFGSECAIFEQPLERWRDIAGSTLRLRDLFRAAYDLLLIWKKYGTASGRPEIAARILDYQCPERELKKPA